MFSDPKPYLGFNATLYRLWKMIEPMMKSSILCEEISPVTVALILLTSGTTGVGIPAS